MIKEIWEQLILGNDVRQNVSRLRKELKEGAGASALRRQMGDQDCVLLSLLQHEDAKTRKNTALLLGDLGDQKYLAPLFEAYEAEQQLFVKSAYLSAIKNLDYRQYLPALKARLSELSKQETAPENEKHTMEEVRELSALVVTMDGVRMHPFTGGKDSYDVVLLTNRNFRELTEQELCALSPGAVTKLFNAGVTARVKELDWTDKIRTWQELLFRVGGMTTCPMDPFAAAKTIASSDLLAFLEHSHRGAAPYYFRVEIKSNLELGRKSTFAKRLAAQLEKLTERRLINTTSNYELELRLIENKEGNLNILVKLFTLKDERFTYRRESAAASIRPVNAALTVALAREFLTENGAVLDPFCGVGTMLIERHKAVKADTTYGIDIQGESIEKARINTEQARQIIHYVNRDFFDFTHEYKFDEIITNMPFKQGHMTEEEVLLLYRRFFPAAAEQLKAGGTAVLYTHNLEHVRKMAPSGGFRIVKEFEISKKEGTFVAVLKKNI